MPRINRPIESGRVPVSSHELHESYIVPRRAINDIRLRRSSLWFSAAAGIAKESSSVTARPSRLGSARGRPLPRRWHWNSRPVGLSKPIRSATPPPDAERRREWGASAYRHGPEPMSTPRDPAQRLGSTDFRGFRSTHCKASAPAFCPRRCGGRRAPAPHAEHGREPRERRCPRNPLREAEVSMVNPR
jgi:hypothetical protein